MKFIFPEINAIRNAFIFICDNYYELTQRDFKLTNIHHKL